MEAGELEQARRPGEQARAGRENAGLTDEELAYRIGLDADDLRLVEAGGDPLDLRRWTEWAWALREPWPHPRRQARPGGTFGVALSRSDVIDFSLAVVRVQLGEEDEAVVRRWVSLPP